MTSIKEYNKVIFLVDGCVIFWDYQAMLCLSQTTGYAVHALVCLDEQSGHANLIRDIAGRTGIPKPYLARIFNDLTHRGLVTAKRGYRGRIALARPADEISLLQVVEAVEGPNWIGPCLLGMDDCTACHTCPTHAVWQRASRQIKAVLDKTTLADVTASPMRKPVTRRKERCA